MNRNHAPLIGDVIEWQETRGYKLVQNRPYECRMSCTCGECHGRTVTQSGTVVDVASYSDAVEGTVVDESGTAHRVHFSHAMNRVYVVL